MKNPALVVLGAALGVAHLTAITKHHREARHLELVRLHNELIRDTAADQRFTQITNSGRFTDLDEDTRAQYMNANRWVSLWSVMLRSRFLTTSSMREVAEEFMESPVGRAFWELARNHRRITARDRHDERFNSLMNGAYAEVCHVSAAV
ncbi:MULTISPECIES: DUF6082 family protein [unclassified Streptomyces]|uniref:DUF6082 family protein n=1 Tax=Streptomyces sp. NPDC055082 TaxID=3365718 RepID=UPI0037CEC836